ncbi:uncharacterized protein RCO7_11678 [Rhynchosporium graminicola]|uniref:Peptidase S8/S53 domain-containing protein n=1 Tax=Rhynchosporium graminicola TaxID=2792576 RepID=A0A1E1KY10_9HELO|nr:uncharacterized protein RCO7_11678 [Rhynchosporium commune]
MSKPITVNGNVLVVAEEATSLHARFTNYLYIKGRGAITTEQKRQLASVGVTIFEYIGENTYICRYLPEDLTPIRALDFVEHANVFPNRLKTSPYLDNAIKADEQNATAALYKINVILHKGENATDEFVENLVGVAGIDRNELSVDHNIIQVTATAESIAKIGKLDAVQSIQEFIQNAVHNNLARKDLQVPDGTGTVAGHMYEGSDQIIAVADTGFDLGDENNTHPAFEGRVLALLSEGRSSTSGKKNDFEGHGTHVAGSVLGDGHSKTMGGSIRGTAPKAKLVFQSLSKEQVENQKPQLYTPPNLWDLFITPYESLNARIATNSWGPNWRGAGSRQVPYNSDAGAIDRFMWHHPDHVILFSAGNDGAEPSTTSAHIGGNSAAKNSICVGATESSRGSSNYRYERLPAAGNPQLVAAFSSRGPTFEERLKPDVVAPGVAILSAASRDESVNDIRRNKFGVTDDKLWMFSSGTSMATPLVAGCCAVLREALAKAGLQKPSAALIKALLVNGAVDLHVPREQQGFGRVDLQNSLMSVEKQTDGINGLADSSNNSAMTLEEGEVWLHTITVPQTVTSGFLKVTLAYSDRHGPALQNNLCLKVQVHEVGGDTVIEKRGNEHLRAENNVEQVSCPLSAGSTVVVTVVAERIARLDDSQSFSVVWAVYQL